MGKYCYKTKCYLSFLHKTNHAILLLEPIVAPKNDCRKINFGKIDRGVFEIIGLY